MDDKRREQLESQVLKFQTFYEFMNQFHAERDTFMPQEMFEKFGETCNHPRFYESHGEGKACEVCHRLKSEIDAKS